MRNLTLAKILSPVLALILFLSSPALAETGASPSNGGFDHSHALFDALLKKYVSGGMVDYRGFKSSEEDLDTYLEGLAAVGPRDYSTWGAAEKLAFWLNAYNAFTIKAILDNYPIEGSLFSLYPQNSIRQIDGVWDKVRFGAVGRGVTLNEIEHEILRGEFKEPRIHFAIVCASVGCPLLRSESYKAQIVGKQLEEGARDFVSNPDKVQIKPEKNEVALSKIFKWFGGDFMEGFGTSRHFKKNNPRERAVLNFIRTYSSDGGFEGFSQSRRIKITYLPYDWSLNEHTP